MPTFKSNKRQGMRLESMTTTMIWRLMFLLHFHIIRSSTQSLSCYTASGDNCTSSICPNTVVNYTCTISGTPGGYTDWILLTGTCPQNSFPDTIRLSQFVTGLCSFLLTSTCGPYTALSILPSNSTHCLSSVLTVTVTAAMDGSTVTCSNTNQQSGSTTVVSSAAINVTALPGPARITVQAPTNLPAQLTVTWTPPTTGGIPTSYNVTINDSSSPVVVIADNGSPVYTHVFTGLISDTLYAVSVVAINCAGTSNVTSQKRLTVANPPEGSNTRMMFISDTSKVTQLRITWTPPVGGSVTMYTVRVFGDGTFVGQGNASCSAVVCLLIMYPEKSVIVTKYIVFLASINGYGDVGPESNSTISVVNRISAVHSKDSTASIQCSFQNNQSLYCVVCCSADLSVPPDSSVYNISTTKGTEVTVDLNGLISGQTYYCKAAPTNDSSSQNCTFSGFEGVNTIISFKTMSLPQNTENRGTITVAIILGIVLPAAAIITAVTVAVIVFSAIYFRRKSKAKGERYHTPTTTQAQYEDVGVPKTHSERVNRPVQTDVTESTLYSTPYDKRRKTQSDEAHNSTSGVAWHTYSVLEGPDMTRNGLTEKEMVNRILGTKQDEFHGRTPYNVTGGKQVPGYPHWHIKEPATEGSLDTGVSARKCTPGDGVYALPIASSAMQMEHIATSSDAYELPMDHIASNAMPTEHRANSSDAYALPVDHRGAQGKDGVSADYYI